MVLLERSARLVPVDNVLELPRILPEFEIKLTLLVNDQLSRREENASVLLLVGIVQVKLTRGQVVGRGLGIGIDFAESEYTVGDEANFAARWSRYETNETEVVAKCASDSNAANGLHLCERVHQTLILPLREGFHEDCSVFLGRELIDDHLDVDYRTRLGAGAHRGGVNRSYSQSFFFLTR